MVDGFRTSHRSGGAKTGLGITDTLLEELERGQDQLSHLAHRNESKYIPP